MRRISTALALSLALSGCVTSEVDTTKSDVARGKADGADLCPDLGLEPGCDVCAALGWYGDSVCDDFCDAPDPDCGAAALPTRFECVGVTSGTFFDLTIVDVGDEEGEVYVNDGGAPVSYEASYSGGQAETGFSEHRFVFGFDEYDDGDIAELYAVDVTAVSVDFLRGSVDYAGQSEEIVCYDMEAQPSGEAAPEFQCISVETGTFFDLDVVDVGDQEGRVTINDGGAPASFEAQYDELEENGSRARHRFVFGFDKRNAGEIEDLYSIAIEEQSIDFADGQADYGVTSRVLCHITR